MTCYDALSQSAKEAYAPFVNPEIPHNKINTQMPRCDCPECVLARTSNTSLPELDQLQCVKGNSGGPIQMRNAYNEWASTSMSPWSVPVNGYDFGFYKF